jgi:hypothetical protein
MLVCRPRRNREDRPGINWAGGFGAGLATYRSSRKSTSERSRTFGRASGVAGVAKCLQERSPVGNRRPDFPAIRYPVTGRGVGVRPRRDLYYAEKLVVCSICEVCRNQRLTLFRDRYSALQFVREFVGEHHLVMRLPRAIPKVAAMAGALNRQFTAKLNLAYRPRGSVCRLKLSNPVGESRRPTPVPSH